MKRLLVNLIVLLPLWSQAQFSYIRKQQNIGCYSNDAYSHHVVNKNGEIIMTGYIDSYATGGCTLATSSTSGVSLDGWIAKIDSNWNVMWSQTFGGTKEDRLVKVASCNEGYVAIGYTYSSDGDITVANKGFMDWWVILVDENGRKIWSKTFGSTGFDNPYDIIETSDKGFVIVGSLGKNDGDATGVAIKGSNDAWIVKLNASGNMVWQKTYGTSKSDYASTITQISNKSYIVCGRATAADGDLAGNNGAADMWVFKITDTGNMVWSKNMGGSNTEVANCVLKNSGGDLLIGAQSSSSDYDVKNNYGGIDYWLVKLDTNGNKYWEKNYGGTGDDYLWGIVESIEGGYLLTGNSQSNDNDAVGNHGIYSDILAVKIDDMGKVEWHKMYGGTSGEAVGICHQLKDTSYIMLSIANSNDGDIKKTNGLADAWLVKLGRQDPATVKSEASFGIDVYPTITNGIVNIVTNKHRGEMRFTITNTTGQLVDVPYTDELPKRVYDFSLLPRGMYFITASSGDVYQNYKIVLQ